MLDDRIYLKINTVIDNTNTEKDITRFEKKYKESGEFLSSLDLKLNYLTKAPQNPWFGKIYSVCYGIVFNGKERIEYIQGDEKEMLQTIIKVLNYKDNNRKLLTIFNQEFLLPFITTRLAKHNIDIRKLPKQIDHLNKKPWEIKGVLDYYSYFKGVGWFRPSFLDVCSLKELPTDFLFSDTREMKDEELKEYTLCYLNNLIFLDRKVNMLEDIVIEPKKDIVEKTDFDMPVIEEIYKTQNIDGEQADKIISKFKGSGKEEEVLTIVKSALMVDNKEKEIYDIGGYRLLLKEFGKEVNNYEGLFDSLKVFNKKEANLLLKKYTKLNEEGKESIINTISDFVDKKTTKSDRTKEALKYFVKEI